MPKVIAISWKGGTAPVEEVKSAKVAQRRTAMAPIIVARRVADWVVAAMEVSVMARLLWQAARESSR